MPTFLVHLHNLETLDEGPEEMDVQLEVEDDSESYYAEDGNGIWIRAFLEFLERKVLERCLVGRGQPGTGRHSPRFTFSDTDRLNQDLLEEVQDPYLRSLFIGFTNRHYEPYRDEDVSMPDYDEVRCECRDYCGDCETGWTEEYREYDGPLAEEVEAGEDEARPGLTNEERRAMNLRNREREAERERRRLAQEEAESEVIDREFTCDGDCDSFLDHVSEYFDGGIDTHLDALERRWDEFLDEIGETVRPAFHPEVRLEEAPFDMKSLGAIHPRANPGCEACHGRGWAIFVRANAGVYPLYTGRAAVQRCDECGVFEHDEQAALAARASGIACRMTYPCILLKENERP